jgi:23S rRNA pseudouridine2605 synthase
VLARAGVSSRREAETLIAAGRVRVDGRVVSEPGTRIDPESAQVEVDGAPVAASEHVYLVMNKPDQMVSTPEPERDANGRPTVSSLLTGVTARVFAVGRLGYHTRGALILTNDGTLAEALLQARRAVPRTYHVKMQGRLDEDALASLHAGVVLDDGARTRPALEVELVKATRTNTWVQMTISQELPRQLVRMGEAIGHSVLKVIRVAFANITADGLREGEWRRLREEEIATLRSAAGQRPAKGILAFAQAAVEPSARMRQSARVRTPKPAPTRSSGNRSGQTGPQPGPKTEPQAPPKPKAHARPKTSTEGSRPVHKGPKGPKPGSKHGPGAGASGPAKRQRDPGARTAQTRLASRRR